MKSEKYVTVLAILNAMAARVASSLPQIEQATRGFYPAETQAGADAGRGVAKDV
jgi:hypothetical protein